MATQVILEIVSGPAAGTAFEFDRHDTFLLGRHRSCHVRLSRDPRVSRHHFLIEANPPDIRIRDLGSRNGTLVNGVKHGGRSTGESPQQAAARSQPTIDLHDGDEVTVGRTTIRVKVVGDPPPGNASTVAFAGGPAVQCRQCGVDVSIEAGPGRRGAYVCRNCREALAAEEGGFRRLLQQAAAQTAPRALEIRGYELGEKLGSGGMGVVYRAERKRDGRLVAVKIALPKIVLVDAKRDSFLREIAILTQLAHPHIVRLLDHGATDAAFYFIMEYCNGGSLADRILQQGGPIPLAAALPIMIQCLDALAHAHRQGFVHRDLKPGNILLHYRNGARTAKISDFGLAKNFEIAGLSGMTATGNVSGTYRFMPREQLTAFKYVQPASDIWSLGATFYSMLTGCFPLDFPAHRDPLEVLLHDEPTPLRQRLPTAPAGVAEILDRALQSDPDSRYATAVEMQAALLAYVRQAGMESGEGGAAP